MAFRLLQADRSQLGHWEGFNENWSHTPVHLHGRFRHHPLHLLSILVGLRAGKKLRKARERNLRRLADSLPVPTYYQPAEYPALP